MEQTEPSDTALRIRRRQVRPNTELVHRVLDRLAEAEASWSPRFVGVDGDQEVLTWLPGQPIDDWWQRPDLLDELVRAVRQLHDTTAGFSPHHECLVHDDLQTRNVVIDGCRLGIIDWEQLRPGHRVEDVAQLCWSFGGGPTNRRVREVGDRWRRIVDAYGLTERPDVVDTAVRKIDRCQP